MGEFMGFKSLALAGAAAAAVSAGMAAPALAAEPMHHGHGGHGCHVFCVAKVYKKGVKYGTVKVFVSKHSIRGVLHLTKDAKKGYYGIKGHCKPVRHHVTPPPPPRPVIFHHHQVRFVPRASGTGFGGASTEQANLPLIGGALAMIGGGLGVGVLARRRVSGALS
jgi:hypothetical protein